MNTADDDRFRDYVQQRRGDLMRTAIFLAAGDRWIAEDLVQTALARLYVSWSRIEAGAADAYARRCLLNALIDHKRLAVTRRERSHAQPPEPVADESPQTLDRRSGVFRALAALPPRMRAAVVLRHLLDLSVEETARALRCRTGTVKSQTARGLDQLRAALQDEGIALTGDEARPDPDPPRRPAPRGDLNRLSAR